MGIDGRGKIKVKSIKKWIILQYTIVIFITIFIFELLFFIGIRQHYYGNISQVLQDKALFSSNFYSKYLNYSSIEYKAKYIIENTSDEYAEIQVIDLDGNIIQTSTGFFSDIKVDTMDFTNALLGKITSWRGERINTGESVIAVSAPLKDGDDIKGVIRYVTSIEEVNKVVNKLIIQLLVLGCIILIVVLSLSMLLARSIINPINQLKKVSAKMATGDFSARVRNIKDNEIGELANTLNYMAEEIVKSNNVKNDFISSISHEIRTPLTSIKGWIETMLLGELDNKEEIKEELSIISSETNRLTDLVEELLDFSRFQSGRMEIQLEKVDLGTLITDVIKQFLPRIKSKDITLEYTIDDEITYIVGDYNRLKQVLINILDNGIKFTHSGGKIQVTTELIDNYVVVCVKDNGIGVDKEKLNKLTDKFYKGDARYPGSGLGLAISDEIIKLHNGKIVIDSQKGLGTKVCIFLKNPLLTDK